MERSEIIENIKVILTAVLGHDRFEVVDELVAADVVGWDSLTHMIIITKLEEQFSVKFKLKELNKLKNMRTLIELIQSKL